MIKSLTVAVFALGVMAVSLPAKAAPVVFEYNYSNHAWGYQNKGCFVDEDGFIYSYKVNSGEPFKVEGKVAKDEFTAAKELLKSASVGVFSAKRDAYDAGTHLWSGYLFGTQVKLKQSGDTKGQNAAPQAAELSKLIDSWCKAVD